jgi:hypothetical protein
MLKARREELLSLMENTPKETLVQMILEIDDEVEQFLMVKHAIHIKRYQDVISKSDVLYEAIRPKSDKLLPRDAGAEESYEQYLKPLEIAGLEYRGGTLYYEGVPYVATQTLTEPKALMLDAHKEEYGSERNVKLQGAIDEKLPEIHIEVY